MLIHGLWDHSRSWDWIAEVLARQYRVIAPDLRGHGDGSWASPDGYTHGAYVLDLADVMQALAPGRLALD
jgi:pimeloyl-ACP methyl ester carboxylesterase